MANRNVRYHLRNLQQKIVPILKSNDVVKAGLFGSYVRGEAKKNSDIDILVEVKKEADLIDFIRLKNTLEKAVKRKVDLVEYDCIRREIKHNVLREEMLIIK